MGRTNKMKEKKTAIRHQSSFGQLTSRMMQCIMIHTDPMSVIHRKYISTPNVSDLPLAHNHSQQYRDGPKGNATPKPREPMVNTSQPRDEPMNDNTSQQRDEPMNSDTSQQRDESMNSDTAQRRDDL